MTHTPGDDSRDRVTELRGWRLVGATILAVVLGAAYVTWKYYKHHVIFPELGPNMWILYAVIVAVLVTLGGGDALRHKAAMTRGCPPRHEHPATVSTRSIVMRVRQAYCR